MNDWSFTFSVEVDASYGSALASMIGHLAEAGFDPFPGAGQVCLWAGDEGSSANVARSDLVGLLVANGGAFQVEHRARSVAMDIFVGGDCVEATVSGWTFVRDDRATAWGSIHRALLRLAEVLPLRELRGMSEDMVETALSRFAGDPDASLAWLTLAPSASPSGRELAKTADMLGLPLQRSGHNVELLLSPNPWDDDLRSFVDHNLALRTATGRAD